ncbi:HAD family hydrolase [Clostridium sp. MB05]|uniref:HAD family hydrolase n=1 Tax=Clostridium sp. MB05 TaxID=3376682 RepID=UPI0039827F56
MYKNIIFDIGNVLLSFNPKEYLKEKIQEEKLENLYKEIFQSEEWVMLDRGTIKEEEAINNIIKRNTDYSNDIKLAFKDWYDILKPIDKTIEILQDLKNNGYNIFYLSNFHDLAFNHVKMKNEFFNLFDGGVVSFEEKIIKPEEDIYNLILSRYKLIAKESIFIDDTKINLEGAENVGINTLLFSTPENLKNDLRELNINI